VARFFLTLDVCLSHRQWVEAHVRAVFSRDCNENSIEI
jgi:hypothetical protein